MKMYIIYCRERGFFQRGNWLMILAKNLTFLFSSFLAWKWYIAFLGYDTSYMGAKLASFIDDCGQKFNIVYGSFFAWKCYKRKKGCFSDRKKAHDLAYKNVPHK